jgi:hypothetical protein
LLLAGGVDVLEVAGQAGHANASMMLNVYGHRMPSGRDKVRQAAERSLGGSWSVRRGPATRGELERQASPTVRRNSVHLL